MNGWVWSLSGRLLKAFGRRVAQPPIDQISGERRRRVTNRDWIRRSGTGPNCVGTGPPKVLRPHWGHISPNMSLRANRLTAKNWPGYACFGGAGDRTRTGDILLGRQTLYQLRYSRKGGLRWPICPVSGRGGGTRTPDLSVPNAARYQLRYTPRAPIAGGSIAEIPHRRRGLQQPNWTKVTRVPQGEARPR